MKNITWITFLVVLFNGAIAQENGEHKLREERFEEMHQEREKRFEQSIAEIPGITKQQKAQIKAVHQKHIDSRTDLRELLKKNRELNQANGKSFKDLSPEEKKDLIDMRHKMMAEIEKARVDEGEEILRVLNPEQQKWYKENHMNRMHKRKEKHPRAGGPKEMYH